ncbi:hypothetical protein LXA47_25430 [Massilia sp. P8910]|uniref:hypothetical protein n=1 Tax=Massilia antarctica TaxID=2765360 RepID=UPI001E3790BE|nr:hypothetical protein [Massilia antarctica]MCE3606921.1 hypothetical protein [Massilia antarctica]
MKVSRDFLLDFAYLANLYAWTTADIEEVKAQTRANPEPMRQYWTLLAAAHRAGYKQEKANDYERLGAWIQRVPEFADQYAHAREAISAGIARVREAATTLSDQYAPARVRHA